MVRWFAVLALVPSLAAAEIYQCQVDGQTVFADAPCGSDSRQVKVDPVTVGGQLDTGTDAEFYQAPERSRQSARCQHINSSTLKTLSIQNKVVSGMKPADVRRSWGSPTSIRTSKGLTQWAYHYDSGSAQYVYFRDGCVSNTSSYSRF